WRFFLSSRRRHTRSKRDWSSDVCSSDLHNIKQGDTLDIMVTKHGKEENQGVGYLEDGTMVVIEDGRKLVNQTVNVEVTSVLQTRSEERRVGKERRARSGREEAKRKNGVR